MARSFASPHHRRPLVPAGEPAPRDLLQLAPADARRTSERGVPDGATASLPRTPRDTSHLDVVRPAQSLHFHQYASIHSSAPRPAVHHTHMNALPPPHARAIWNSPKRSQAQRFKDIAANNRLCVRIVFGKPVRFDRELCLWFTASCIE